MKRGGPNTMTALRAMIDADVIQVVWKLIFQVVGSLMNIFLG